MCDLIVIGYPDELRTESVWNELVKLQEDHLHITTPAHHAAMTETTRLRVDDGEDDFQG
jgi:uncharacterized membrane protein